MTGGWLFGTLAGAAGLGLVWGELGRLGSFSWKEPPRLRAPVVPLFPEFAGLALVLALGWVVVPLELPLLGLLELLGLVLREPLLPVPELELLGLVLREPLLPELPLLRELLLLELPLLRELLLAWAIVS